MKVAFAVAGMALTLSLASGRLYAQEAQAAHAPEPAAHPETETHPQEPKTRAEFNALPTRIFLLKNASQTNDANEILTGLRLMLDPTLKLYLVFGQNEILVKGTPEQLAQAQKLIDEMDRPKRNFRITYTVTDMDGGRRAGVQHFTMTAEAGSRITLKQGSKVPILTSSFAKGKTDEQSQFTYLDVGLNFDSTINDFAGGISLKSHVEQSSVAEEKSSVSSEDPIIRETSLEGVSIVPIGKLSSLGSLDIPGTTRHLDIEVLIEQIR